MVPLRVSVPAPVLVRLPVEVAIGSAIDEVPTESMVKLKVPVIALPEATFKAKVVPVSIWISASAAKVIRPDKVLESATLRIAPLVEIPVPPIVIASATVMLLLKCRAAPEATVVVPAVVPRALLWVIAITPLLMVVSPV